MYILSSSVPVMYKMYIYLPSCVNMHYIYLQASSELYICIYTSLNASRPVLLDDWGPKGPLLKKPQLFFFLHIDGSSWRNKIAYTIIFGPMVLIVQNLNIYPLPPVAGFILVILSLNLVVSCPYVSYYLYLHILYAF